MHLNIIPEKKTGRKLMVYVETFKGEDHKQHQRTVEKIGYVDEFLDKYPDPVAHFREEARKKTEGLGEKAKNGIVNLSIQKDGIMRFDGNGEYDIRIHYGDAFIAWVIHRLRLDRFVDNRRKYLDLNYNLTNLMRLFIYERILSPSSKLTNWKNRGSYYEKMDFTQAQIYSGLQQIGEYKEDMLVHLDKVMKELYGRQAGYGYFDGTNVYYEIEDEDGFREKGCSKENRPLPITQLGVLLDSNGFPMSYDVWPGNTNDCIMLPPAVKRARERFGMKHMVYVADKGFYSGDTIANIMINHDGYVISNSVRGKKIDEETRKKVLDRSDYICLDAAGKEQDAFNESTQFMYKTIDMVGNCNVTEINGDRRLLDKQITDNIRAFGHSMNTIAHADSSKELKEAIEQGKRIIITTIQKFPFICDSISNVGHKNFAIIIDEAHSSQSGIAADKMNASMQHDPDTGGADSDEMIAKLMKDRKMSDNCSYFAFTATPKKETLERFGIEDDEGHFHPFHLYSMKQAIEEGFILNVLANYTTYKGYYELVKSIRENPQYNNEKAQKFRPPCRWRHRLKYSW